MNELRGQLGLPTVVAPPDTAAILYAKTAEWIANDGVSKIRTIYVYTDCIKDDYGNVTPAIKIGDGKTILSELPFVSTDASGGGSTPTPAPPEPGPDGRYPDYYVSPDDRLTWNNKVSIQFDSDNPENIFFLASLT